MQIELLPLYVLIGALSGVLGGALGLGGGIVVVPMLLLIFHLRDIDPLVITQLAVATSLATIIVTSIGAVRAHHQRGNMRWPLVWRLSTGVVLGAFAGAFVADWLSGPRLAQLFGLFAVILSVQMVLNSLRKVVLDAPERLPGTPGLTLAGGAIGLVSSMFGIGGGSLTVPFLTWRSLTMQQAVATSSACGFPIAVASAISFMILGWHDSLLPPHSLGFVYLPALIGIAVTSMFFARFGAKLAHKLSPRVLKRLFALLLVVVGTSFLI